MALLMPRFLLYRVSGYGIIHFSKLGWREETGYREKRIFFKAVLNFLAL
jgi:hypothetical protein